MSGDGGRSHDHRSLGAEVSESGHRGGEEVGNDGRCAHSARRSRVASSPTETRIRSLYVMDRERPGLTWILRRLPSK